jgi:hypothetical protein
MLNISSAVIRFPHSRQNVFYCAYATEDSIESWSGIPESPSLKEASVAPVKLFAAAALTAAALGSSCDEEPCGRFGELFRKL